MGEYVGFDVSKEETAFCVMDAAGKVLARGKVASDPDALFEVLREHCLCPKRIVLETGTLTPTMTGRSPRPGRASGKALLREAPGASRSRHRAFRSIRAVTLAIGSGGDRTR